MSKIKSFVRTQGEIQLIDVEVQLLRGLPVMHIVGMPDGGIREADKRLKSAFLAQGFTWPRTHQIVVNLRPSYGRKTSQGLDLAVAMALLQATRQIHLPKDLGELVVYGDVGVDGQVYQANDWARIYEVAIMMADNSLTSSQNNSQGHLQNSSGQRIYLSGADANSSDGNCLRVKQLADVLQLNWSQALLETKTEDSPEEQELAALTPPSLPDLSFGARASQALLLAALGEHSVLLLGPPGSGKTTWCRALHALTARPRLSERREWRRQFGLQSPMPGWRPLCQPHHSITALAMIGGGHPIFPGEITRAHGGLLVLDELLEFEPQVLEALREPMEAGFLSITRHGSAVRMPARAQVIGTSNLCPCGKLRPSNPRHCSYSLKHCQSTLRRLSGPLLDRFDMVLFTHDWQNGRRQTTAELAHRLQHVRSVLQQRSVQVPELASIGQRPEQVPLLATPWIAPDASLRRQRALLKVAQTLSWLEDPQAVEPSGRHYTQAFEWTTATAGQLGQLFA